MPPKNQRKKPPTDNKTESRVAPDRERASAPKPSILTIGDELEYRIARMQIFTGFFVRRGCPIYTIGGLDRATDLDVLAFRHSEPFRREMIITECKSGGTAPLDRIFWLTGVRAYTGATQAFLVRKGTKWNIKDFAKECGVQVLDLARVTEIEASLKIDENEWPGVSERAFFEKNLADWNRVMIAETRFWELYQTLTSEIRFDDAFVGINYLLSQLRQMTRQFVKPPEQPYYRFLLSESITQLAVFLIRLAERSFDLGADDRHGFMRKGLTYGNLEPQYADRILNSAYNMTRQAVQHYTHKLVDIDRALFSMPMPPGTDELVEIVDSLLGAYPACLSFPQICDLMLFEVFTKRKEARGWLKRIFPQSDLSGRVDLVRKFLATLVSIGACPAYLPDIVFSAARPAITADAKPKAGAEPVPAAESPSVAAENTKSEGSEKVEAQPSQKTKEANRNVESEPKQENLDLSSGAASGAHDTTSVKD
jgi:hypothetical protein